MTLRADARPLLAAMLLLSAAAQAQTPPASVDVTHPWSRATPPGATTGAAYMTLQSPTADKLIGVSSDAAASAAVHSMTMAGNVMQMRDVPGGLDLPPGKPVVLRPGGYHVMLMDLKAPLKPGQSVRLHLTFQHAPAVDVTAPVAAIGATAAPGAMPVR